MPLVIDLWRRHAKQSVQFAGFEQSMDSKRKNPATTSTVDAMSISSGTHLIGSCHSDNPARRESSGMFQCRLT
jgi:hypothetical protein